MMKIGPMSEMKTAYKKDWPLFKEFRKTALFKRTYEQIFHESFITRNKKTQDDEAGVHAENDNNKIN